MKRRSFIKNTAATAAGAYASPHLLNANSRFNGNSDNPMIGIQIGAVSFYDEGVKAVLDNVQNLAGVNTLFIPVYAYNRGLAGRQIPGEPFPDHGKQIPDENFVGGYYATMHDKYYKKSIYKPEHARAPELDDFDVLAEVIPEAHKRGMKVIAFFADNFSKSRPHSGKLCEYDIYGNQTGSVNLINPNYRNFVKAITEDCIRSYPIDGLLWRTERTGPLSDTLGFGHSSKMGKPNPTSFDEYTLEYASKKGINSKRVKEGYLKLIDFLLEIRKGNKPVDGHYVTFQRITMEYPEILAWHQTAVDILRDTYKMIYTFSKDIQKDLPVGWALSFKGMYNPYYRARQDLQELGKYSDFMKIVMYTNVGGVRFHTFTRYATQSIYGDMTQQEVLGFISGIMGYQPLNLETIRQNGLPPEIVYKETVRAIEGAKGTPMNVWPAIDIDIPARRFGMKNPPYAKRTPESVKEDVKAVFRGGAKGIILARKYSEMYLSNLKGVGMALDELGLR